MRIASSVDAIGFGAGPDVVDLFGLEQLEDVVARHLLRFAFREEPAVEWRRE